jgi:hypothetical protein
MTRCGESTQGRSDDGRNRQCEALNRFVITDPVDCMRKAGATAAAPLATTFRAIPRTASGLVGDFFTTPLDFPRCGAADRWIYA